MIGHLSVSLADARVAVEAIITAARQNEAPLAISVVDGDGYMVYQVRQDGAPARMLSRARSKAYTAANLGLDTVVFRDEQVKAKQRTLDDWGDPMLTTLQGGIAVKVNGKVVGGIAMSGNTTIRDEALARIGLNAMRLAEQA